MTTTTTLIVNASVDVAAMASSRSALTPDSDKLNMEWTVVSHRSGRIKNIPTRNPQEQESWIPTESDADTDRISKLMKKMSVCVEMLQNSQFFQDFMDQIESSNFQCCISRALGLEKKMDMVIYGIGSIESCNSPKLQLSLAVLMKRNLSWIGDVEVFDPIISTTESRVLQSLGCSVLSVNEHGERVASKPTLFFMPHCESQLYDNLLRANWAVDGLKRIALFGNSFEAYKEYVSDYKNSSMVASAKHLLDANEFTMEIKIKISSDECYDPFHDSSWHFFPIDSAALDPFICIHNREQGESRPIKDETDSKSAFK